MADKNNYENFPFDELTHEQIAALMMEEIRLDGDRDFIATCREHLIHRNPTKERGETNGRK